MCRHKNLSNSTMISNDFECEDQLNMHSATPCHRYLLALPLKPSHRGLLLVVGCNPSTADANTDDPTLVKLQTWATFNGYSHLAVVNMFSYRGTSPRKMKAAGTMTFLEGGGEVDMWIERAASIASDIVLAMGDIAFKSWGNFKNPFHSTSESGKDRRIRARSRLVEIVDLIRREKQKESKIFAFCLTKAAFPGHILYLPNSLKSRDNWLEMTEHNFDTG